MASRFVWVPAGLFAVWLVVGHQWYVCHIKQACMTAAASSEGAPRSEPGSPAALAHAASDAGVPPLSAGAESPATPAPDARPLVFAWNTPKPLTRESLAEFRRSLIEQLSPGKILAITGLHFRGESAPDGFENMGLARAAEIRALFVPPLSPQQIIETSRLVDAAPTDGKAGGLFVGAEFDIRAAAIRETPDAQQKVPDGAQAILFASGSSVAEIDPAVASLLEGLASKIRESNASATVVGHTDGKGSRGINTQLGLKRAEHVRDLLVAKGVPSSRLRIRSEGSASPVAGDESEEGRQRNRRVEIVLEAASSERGL